MVISTGLLRRCHGWNNIKKRPNTEHEWMYIWMIATNRSIICLPDHWMNWIGIWPRHRCAHETREEHIDIGVSVQNSHFVSFVNGSKCPIWPSTHLSMQMQTLCHGCRQRPGRRYTHKQPHKQRCFGWRQQQRRRAKKPAIFPNYKQSTCSPWPIKIRSKRVETNDGNTLPLDCPRIFIYIYTKQKQYSKQSCVTQNAQWYTK